MKVTGGQRSLLARGYAKLQKRAISKKRKGGIKPHCQLCVSFALKTSITQSPILLDNPPPPPIPTLLLLLFAPYGQCSMRNIVLSLGNQNVDICTDKR